jgi:hypothetical protein
MFRTLRFLVFLDQKGRIMSRHHDFTLVDPELETPLAEVREAAGSFTVQWFPDWMRAPAHRFSWQQAADASAFVDPAKGLRGQAAVIVHNTGSGNHSLSTVLAGLRFHGTIGPRTR